MTALRVGIIGAGRVAALHAAGFTALSGVDIVAVADPRPGAAAALADGFAAQAYPDAAALLDRSDVDAVAIAVPHDLHRELAIAALRAGRHVFMDKPLATSVADGAAVVAAAEQSGRVLMLCHNLLFHPVVAEAGRLLAAGAVGRLTTCDAWSSGFLDLMPWDFRLSRERTGGGVWADNGPHLLYVLQDWCGPIVECTAYANRGASRLGGEDACAAVLRMQGGATGTIRMSYADRLPGHERPWPAGWSMGFEARGTGGVLRVEVLPRPVLTVYTGSGEPASTALDAPFEASFAGAIAEFVAAVRGNRPPRVTGADSLQILRLVCDTYQP